MKKSIAKVLIIAVAVIILLLGSNILLGLFYKKSFAVNTWINDIYCTGSSVEEINRQLIEKTEFQDLVIVDLTGKQYRISHEDIDISVDYSSDLRKIMKQRSNYFWTKTLFEPYKTEVQPKYFSWDHDKLVEELNRQSFILQEQRRSTEYKLFYTPNVGYEYYDGKQDRLNTESALLACENALSEGKFVVELNEYGCYETIPDTEEESRQRELWNELQEYYQCGIVYDMGAEQIGFTPADMASFINRDGKGLPMKNASGEFSLNEGVVNAWLDRLGHTYNTVNTTRDFQTTEGRIVKVTYNTYGTLLDMDAEKEYLYQALVDKKKEVHTPVYLQEGYFKGQDDIGPTYIEVDMGMQHLYYYVDGELTIEADVVTGNVKRKTTTPEGINFVYDKQRNRTLRGPGYATPVKYWIPVVGHIGIHDASWRKEFGGDIYLTNGSHGCVNTPMPEIGDLYELVEIGTPVIMFY